MIYVVKMDNPKNSRDQGTPTRVRLIGPFGNARLACMWARDKKNNPHDNPCWQVVDLELAPGQDFPLVEVETPYEPLREAIEKGPDHNRRFVGQGHRHHHLSIAVFNPLTDSKISTDRELLQQLADNLVWADS